MWNATSISYSPKLGTLILMPRMFGNAATGWLKGGIISRVNKSDVPFIYLFQSKVYKDLFLNNLKINQHQILTLYTWHRCFPLLIYIHLLSWACMNVAKLCGAEPYYICRKKWNRKKTGLGMMLAPWNFILNYDQPHECTDGKLLLVMSGSICWAWGKFHIKTQFQLWPKGEEKFYESSRITLWMPSPQLLWTDAHGERRPKWNKRHGSQTQSI